MLLVIVLVIVVAGLLYIRLAPTDISRWHAAAKPGPIGEKTLKGGYIWRAAAGDDGKAMLEQINAAALATPRTQMLTGSVEAGQITYVTRSKIFGFPDYTTVGIYEGPDGQPVIEAYGRLRYGLSDLGVNANRIKGWIGTLKP